MNSYSWAICCGTSLNEPEVAPQEQSAMDQVAKIVLDARKKKLKREMAGEGD